MIRQAISVITLAVVLGPGSAPAQPRSAADATVLGTVRLTHAVLADGKPLPTGTYQIRLTTERLTPLPGQSPDAERWVEFVMNGMVVARGVAVVMTGAPVPVGTSGSSATSHACRCSRAATSFVSRSTTEGARYLIHLPVAR